EEASSSWRVANPPQPDPEHGKRVVACTEAGQQQHWTAVSVGDSVTPKDWVGQHAVELELPAELAKMVAPPARVSLGLRFWRCGLGGGIGSRPDSGDPVSAHGHSFPGPQRPACAER